jgi:FkbM family methyltransferase
MKEYESLYHYRKDTVDGIGPWYWLKSDVKSWDGPKSDWEEYHKGIVLKTVKQFRTVIQAGGCQGMYPRLYAEMFQRVYTFEPDPWNFHALTVNCQKDNIVKIQAALGNSHKMINVHRLTMENVGEHRVVDGFNYPMFMLDVFDFDSVDLIHLDTEEYEYAVLEGAQDTISKHKPVILAERPNGNINRLLRGLGYRYAGRSAYDGIYLCQ